jgi:hypothetical protein
MKEVAMRVGIFPNLSARLTRKREMKTSEITMAACREVTSYYPNPLKYRCCRKMTAIMPKENMRSDRVMKSSVKSRR